MRSEPTHRPRLAGVIVTHAGMAQALRQAVVSVAGEVAGLEAVSNADMGPEELGEHVRSLVDRLGAEGCVVFVDSRGSSCAAACLTALHRDPRVRVVSGVNLPMLVHFVGHREETDLDGIVQQLLRRGRDAVELLPGGGP